MDFTGSFVFLFIYFSISLAMRFKPTLYNFAESDGVFWRLCARTLKIELLILSF